MIKLTEIYSNAGNYDPEIKKVISTYGLRSLYINPDYVVLLSDNDKYNDMHDRQVLVKDLIPEARFSKMAVASGVHGTTYYDLLGAPSQILESMKDQ